MNLLLVNPIHPSTPHISGVRAWRFACELASMGHHVVLLTGSRQDSDSHGALSNPETHDWRQPLVLDSAVFAEMAPSGRSGGLRKIRTLWQMLRHGGYHSAWSNAAVKAVERHASVFRPQVIWATIGKMESAFVARRLSRTLGVPWVLDLKDSWELYVPAPLRLAMARRVSGWKAVTANAESTGADARRWHRAEPRVVYSGVDNAFFPTEPTQVPVGGAGDRFVINIVGSLYFSDRLQEVLLGIGRWSSGLSLAERERVQLCYFGGDTKMFEQAVQLNPPMVSTRAEGYIPVEEMASAARAAAVNIYISHDGNFHHKLLELLACGRPVMAFPSECDESRRLSAQVNGELIEPGDKHGVVAALDGIHRRRSSNRPSLDIAVNQFPTRQYSWNAQAHLLEKVLVDAARH